MPTTSSRCSRVAPFAYAQSKVSAGKTSFGDAPCGSIQGPSRTRGTVVRRAPPPASGATTRASPMGVGVLRPAAVLIDDETGGWTSPVDGRKAPSFNNGPGPTPGAWEELVEWQEGEGAPAVALRCSRRPRSRSGADCRRLVLNMIWDNDPGAGRHRRRRGADRPPLRSTTWRGGPLIDRSAALVRS
jgi:hypothetical protein